MNILVVSPHPDDETLGCGGTLLKHGARGDSLFWLIMTTMSKDVGYGEEQIQSRAQEITEVTRAYHFEKVFPFDFATTTLDTVPQRVLVGAVASMVSEIKPEVVYVNNRSDAHSDHRVTFEAVFAAIKTFRAPSVKRVLSYEVLSETEFSLPLPSDVFTPNSFSDISNYVDRKIEIMRLYKNELGEHPFPRSEKNIRALATVRGATANVAYAEAFMLLKEIV